MYPESASKHIWQMGLQVKRPNKQTINRAMHVVFFATSSFICLAVPFYPFSLLLRSSHLSNALLASKPVAEQTVEFVLQTRQPAALLGEEACHEWMIPRDRHDRTLIMDNDEHVTYIILGSIEPCPETRVGPSV
jgi:hypothetical protein